MHPSLFSLLPPSSSSPLHPPSSSSSSSSSSLGCPKPLSLGHPSHRAAIMTSMTEYRYSGGSSDGPISPDAWKRAVYQRPPNNFHIKLLPPEKQGSGYSYGFRIYAVKSDTASTISRPTSSGDSIVSLDEYDIWRRWEDCLWFQDTLEVEYARAAREKRNRLAAGKGVKKNGIYIQSDHAASWESLPFGPNPSDIARDIHNYIPKLSKKGTLFRASHETVSQRYADLQKMMQTLLQDDLPTLIKEIKTTRSFTDFFGVWRRDLDLARKSSKKYTFDGSRSSISPNKRATLPASSLPASSSISTVSFLDKGKAPETPSNPFRASTHSDSSSDDSADPSRRSQSSTRHQINSMRSRASSLESRSSSSSPSTPVTMPPQLPPTCQQPVVVSHEVLARFGHNPHSPLSLHVERSPSILESLPEDRELSSSPKSDVDGGWARRRSGSTASSRMNRNARVYVPSPSGSPQYSDLSSRSLPRYSRTSMQSRYSSATLGANAYLDELDVDYCLSSPPVFRPRARTSVSSLASVMTNASVDAVIPRSDRISRTPGNYASRPISLPDGSWKTQEQWSEGESENQGDILDTYFYDLIGPNSPTSSGFPQTPTTEEAMFQASLKSPNSSYSRYSDSRSSYATSVSSCSSSSSGSTSLSIKAIHEESIVMLRLPRDITFEGLRRKIYDKFIQSDKSTICKTFAIALMEQPLGEWGSAPFKGSALHFISSQDEWDDVVAIQGGKLLLRIIGSRE